MIKNVKKLWSGKIKKDQFIIMILAGILILIIAWPAEKNAASEESSLSDSMSDIMNLSGTGSVETYESSSSADLKDEAMQTELAAYAEYLEAKLEAALSKMEGAGQTKVIVTLSSSAEIIVEKDSPTKRAGTTEVDSAGGSRNTTDIETGQETVYYTNDAGRQVPFTKKIIQPLVEGVLVVTQGGGNEKIIRQITEAIKALFGLDEHKIKIVKMVS